ncbi:putative membrane protein [Vibrio vulnificus]|nr:putative membrane protein [Vibrio vulnificus]
MSKQPSLIGGACIIASVCVGAGMLGLPQRRGWRVDALVSIGSHSYHGRHDSIWLAAARSF